MRSFPSASTQDRAVHGPDHPTVLAAARPARATGRPARPAPPECSALFAPLSLDGVRAYRQLVGQEEQRVGYWRSVVAARLKAIQGGGNDLDVERLRPAVARQPLADGRAALLVVLPMALPPLPDLAAIWPGTAETEPAVAAAAEKLAAYQERLTELVRASTAELIARYRQSPVDCLAALPA